MSSFYDDASLVVIPSGYKTSKVYSVKPTDGSGDLTFTRSNDTATRVNSAGLIEKVRTNLALYSEQFNDAYWTKTDITVTANTTANPVNGATTADTLTRTGASNGFINRQISQTGIVTFSVFAKAGSTNLVRLNTYDGVVDRGATYNLTTGAITGAYGSPLFTKAQSLSDGWYRISISVNSSTYTRCQVHIDTINSVIVFGAQLETGDIATPYIATTSAAVSVGPVANVPRLDYLGSTCPRLLLEPQRTNDLTYSEQFDNAAWVKSNATVTENTTVSPDGYTNADTLVENTSSAEHYIQRNITVTSSISYTASLYVKTTGASRNIRLNVFQSTSPFTSVGSVLVNPATGAIVTSSGTVSVVNVGSGWYRISISGTTTSTGVSMRVQLATGTTFNYTGNGTSGVFVWGAQLEAGDYATSYIPTLGSASTRGIDAASKTGISSLIGQSAGALFLDFQYNQPSPDVNGRLLQVYATNDTTNAIVPLIFGAGANVNQFQLTTFSGGGTAVAITASAATVVPFGRQKFAIAYNAGAYTVYRNGSLFASGSGLTPASLTAMDLGGSSFATRNLGNPINEVLLFTTRLTDAQLAELTTL